MSVSDWDTTFLLYVSPFTYPHPPFQINCSRRFCPPCTFLCYTFRLITSVVSNVHADAIEGVMGVSLALRCALARSLALGFCRSCRHVCGGGAASVSNTHAHSHARSITMGFRVAHVRLSSSQPLDILRLCWLNTRAVRPAVCVRRGEWGGGG